VEFEMTIDWIPTVGIGSIPAVLAWLLSWRLASERERVKAEALEKRLDGHEQAQEETDEGWRQEIHDFREDWKSGMSELRAVAASIAKLQASQDVVNQVTAKALESISDRLDKHEEKISDHGATIKLLTELVTRKGNGG
jgi:phage shock protein A